MNSHEFFVIFTSIINKRRVFLTKGVILHNDNARTNNVSGDSCKASTTGFEGLDTSRYSSNLAPVDFYLFVWTNQNQILGTEGRRQKLASRRALRIRLPVKLESRSKVDHVTTF